MRERKDVLAKWLTLEVGKPIAEAVGEVGGAADIFEWNAEETKRIYGQTQQSRFPDTRVHVYYQPVGVVAALVPWNFPIVLAARKISTSLAEGTMRIVLHWGASSGLGVVDSHLTGPDNASGRFHIYWPNSKRKFFYYKINSLFLSMVF